MYHDHDYDQINFACGLINQYNIVSDNGLRLLARGEGGGGKPPVMGPDLAHNRASQPHQCQVLGYVIRAVLDREHRDVSVKTIAE